jgi:transposase
MLSEQVTDLKAQLTRLLEGHAPALMAVYGTGPDTVSQLLITAGDNPARLRSEAQRRAVASTRTWSTARPCASITATWWVSA